jgi:phytoene/squalene synthetase
LASIYRHLLDRIAADPSAVFRGRVSVSTTRKLAILGVGFVQSLKVRLLG